MTLVTVANIRYYHFLKAMANSIRINSPNIKLVARIVGFTPSLDEFKEKCYENTEFIFDATFSNSSMSEVEIAKDDRQYSYSNNIGIKDINEHLKNSPLIYSDADCIIRKDVSIVESYLQESDICLLPTFNRFSIAVDKFYQFGFVPMRNSLAVKSFFEDFEKQLNPYQPNNECMFNEILSKHKLKIHEFDDSFVSGVNGTEWDENAYVWHCCGFKKHLDKRFRQEFRKYLQS